MAALHARCFTEPRPFTVDEFAAFLRTPQVFACCEPGGLALGRVTLDEAELLTLAVSPERRRQGLGGRLLAAFERAACARGATAAVLEVSETNAAARALYAAAGYRLAGYRKGYYRGAPGQRVDALVLRKALLPA